MPHRKPSGISSPGQLPVPGALSPKQLSALPRNNARRPTLRLLTIQLFFAFWLYYSTPNAPVCPYSDLRRDTAGGEDIRGPYLLAHGIAVVEI